MNSFANVWKASFQCDKFTIFKQTHLASRGAKGCHEGAVGGQQAMQV